jgi:pseudouridine synthase
MAMAAETSDSNGIMTKMVGGRPTVRLSDRVAELGLCNRVDAERILTETSTDAREGHDDIKEKDAARKVIYVRGEPINDGRDARVPSDESDIEIHLGMPVRLSKRMSELGICSRREAADILNEVKRCGEKDASSLRRLKEVIYLRGEPVMDGAAVKVPPGERYVEIRAGDDPPPMRDSGLKEFVPYPDRPWDEIMGDTIVLNKPVGYVSGQEEHQHVPAVRLLHRRNMHLVDDFDGEAQRHFRDGDALRFDRWKYGGFDMKANSIPKRIRRTLDEDELREKNGLDVDETLSGYAPAGRLDIDSTGVILFTRAGIMARRLIEPESKIPKEYIVRVQPAVQLTAREIEIGLKSLPRPTRDLNLLLKQGNRLAGDRGHLKPLLAAQWLNDDQIRLVLVEGKKRQIRRMCRELVGWHVVELVRTSVGPVKIDSLPEGKWRPLTREEVRSIFDEQPNLSEISTPGDEFRAGAFEAASPAADLGRGIAATLAKRGISEKRVIRVVLDALRKEAGPDGWFPLMKLQAWVGKRLNFLPKEEGKRKQWKEHLLQICRENPLHFVVRGTQHVGLRGEKNTASTLDTSKRVESTSNITPTT